MTLILDKITMPADAPRISRPRLLEVFNDSISCCNSTVIAGRTGSGKTQLTVDFASRCGRPNRLDLHRGPDKLEGWPADVLPAAVLGRPVRAGRS